MENRYLMDRKDNDITPFYRYNSKVDVKAKIISIATHTCAEKNSRLQRLLDMTSRWDGYISVAVCFEQSET